MQKIIEKRELNGFIQRLITKYKVIAPVKKEITKYDYISNVSEIYLDKITLMPLKEFFIPEEEVLFEFEKNKIIQKKSR